MTETTPLDTAHAAMQAAPEDDAARLRYYERLAACELFVLLEAEAQDDRISPRLFEVQDQPYALIFDTEARLALFAGHAAPYAGLSGRTLAGMLAGAGLGMAVNLDVAPSGLMLPPDAVTWLAETLSQGAPSQAQARLNALHPPTGLPESLLRALDARLASAAGLADMAYLAGVTYDNGARGHMLGLIDAAPGAEDALARAVADVLRFSGLEAAALDVAFFRASDPVSARLARVGLRFDLPAPGPVTTPGTPPGSDPDRPPRLR